jgi:hypothetical protein
METTAQKQNNQINNANAVAVDFVEIFDDKFLRAEKAFKAIDHLQYLIETGLTASATITIESVPHKNGIGAGVVINFPDGEVFLSQEDICGLKMKADLCSKGRWGTAEINKIPSQCAFGWKPGTAIDSNGNEIKTFVRKESF